MSEENEADTSCCAACGIAEVDDITLKECGDVISFVIAAIHVRKIINRSTKKHARCEQLNYVTNYCLGNRKAIIMVTVRSAVYLYRLIKRNLA